MDLPSDVSRTAALSRSVRRLAAAWLPPAVIVLGLLSASIWQFRALLAADDEHLPGIDAYIHQAWEVHTREALATSQLPQWDPYLFGGIPHLADIQMLVLYPPAMLLRWLEPAQFLSWMALLHVWIAGVGALVLGRVVGLSWLAAAATALAAAFGGSTASRLYNGHLLVLDSVAWLPWALAFSILSVRRLRVLPHPGLVIVLVIQLLAGYPQGSLYTAGAVALYLLFSVAWPETPVTGAARWRPLAQLMVLGALTVGLSAFQLVPTMRLALETARTAGLPYADATKGAWTLARLATVFWPFSGVDLSPSVRYMTESVAYVGWLLALVVPLAFLDRRQRRVAVFCGLLAVVAVAFALGDRLPLYRLHYALFPGLRLPGRLLVLATVALAVLGGLGLDRLVAMGRRGEWRRLLGPAAISSVAVVAATASVLMQRNEPLGLSVHGWPWVPLVAIAGVVLVSGLAAVAGTRVALLVACAVCAVDLAAFTAGGAYLVRIKPVATLQQWSGPGAGRVYSLCENRIDSVGLLLARRPSLKGPVGVSLRDYVEWLALLEAEDPAETMAGAAVRRDLLNSMNVTTIVACGPVELPGLTLVASVPPVTVYTNEAAWPRAIWTCDVEEMPRARVAAWLRRGRYEEVGRLTYRTLGEDSIDAIGDSTSPLEGLVGSRPCDRHGDVEVMVQDRPDGRLEAEVDAPAAGYVFLSEPYYAERRGFVDGQPVAIRKANLAFTAIPVPAGRHRLELRYEPVTFHLGLGISGLTLALWGVVLMLARRKAGEVPAGGSQPGAVSALLAGDVSRLTRRFSRQALSRPNATYVIWRFIANGRRTARALMTAPYDGKAGAIGREIKERGIVVGPSTMFLTSEGGQALHDVSARMLEISQSAEVRATITRTAADPGRKKAFLIDLVGFPQGVHPDDSLLKLALDPKLLSIVSTYLGFWPCLHSISAWLNFATDAPPELSQLWHRDPEDLKLIKVFIYLSDVGERSGPFTYIPKTNPFGALAGAAAKLEHKKRVSNELMARVFPRESWHVVTGPPHTMILADTVGFHRGGKPETGQRILVTFTYTSGTPMTERSLWVRSAPVWASSAIQRFAVTPLLDGPSRDAGKR